MSTVASLSILERLDMKHTGIRDIRVYKQPKELTPTQGVVTTNNKTKFRYEGVEEWDIFSKFYKAR
jgi:hypothetical protein